MLESIKSLFEQKADREEIKKKAMELSGTPVWMEVVKLFRNIYPLLFVCKCGNGMTTAISPFTLTERYYCAVCTEREETERIRKEGAGALSVFLKRSDDVLKQNGAPSMFIKSNISDFPPQAQKYVSMKKGLYISGDRGTGKTHLAVALMREHLKNMRMLYNGSEYRINLNMIPVFISVPELLLEIRQSYSNGGSSEKEIIDKYTVRDFLVMDDLGVEKSTDWSLQILYIIIDRRYREEKRTIITSNLSLDDLADKLDDRIASRIAGMCVLVPMKGSDRRLK